MRTRAVRVGLGLERDLLREAAREERFESFDEQYRRIDCRVLERAILLALDEQRVLVIRGEKIGRRLFDRLAELLLRQTTKVVGVVNLDGQPIRAPSESCYELHGNLPKGRCYTF